MTTVKNVSCTDAQLLELPEKQPVKTKSQIEVFAGMPVDKMEQNGSEAQGIVAEAFNYSLDENGKRDCIYDKDEAADFNNYRFALDKDNKELRVYNKKTNAKVIIKYDDIENLKSHAYLVHHITSFKSGDITFDLRTMRAVYDTVDGDYVIIPHDFKDVTIRASWIGTIDARFKGHLKLENVSKPGLFCETKTRVILDKETKLAQDSESKIKREREY